MLDHNRKLIMTKHAIQRGAEFQLTPSAMVWLFWHSDKEKLPKDIRRYKDSRYQRGNENVIYRRRDNYIMVAVETENKFDGSPIYLLLTICDQVINLTDNQYRILAE